MGFTDAKKNTTLGWNSPLSYCYRVVEYMGGEFDRESIEEMGSKLSIQIVTAYKDVESKNLPKKIRSFNCSS